MADQIQLQIILEAQVDRVLAGLSSVEKGLAQMQASQGKAAAESSQHQARFEAFTSSVERAAKIFAGIWVLWQAGKDALAGFDSLEKFNLDLQTMTQLLQGNATAASTWMQVASLMNLDVAQIERSLVALSRQMNSASSPALKQMGITAVDARGQLKSVNEVLLEAADYFHRHEGASNNAAIAQQLFGRSGADLVPVLEQGRAGLDTITESARKYGLILTADAIQRNAQFTEELKVSEMAARGLGTTLGNAALPAVAALASGFNNLVAQNLPAFEAAMARAVGYVLGFVQAVTGMSFTLDDSAKVLGSLSVAAGSLGTQQESASASADALARAEDRVRVQAKGATDAIDKQISSLRGMQDAQKFVDDQARLQQQFADKTRDIQKLEQEQYAQKWLGNFQTAADIGDQITKAQEDQGNIQQDLTRGVVDEQTRLKIDSLELQKKSIQEAADAEIKQMERAAKGGAAAFAATGPAILASSKKFAKESGDAFHDILSSAAAKTGQDMGNQLMDAIFGKATTVTMEGHGVNEIQKTIRTGGGQWQVVGRAIGEAIGTGMVTAIGAAGMGAIKAPFHTLGDKIYELAYQIQGNPITANLLGGYVSALRIDAAWLRSFHTGGEVPGAPNEEVPSILLGGEFVLTRDQYRTVQRGMEQMTGPLAAAVSPQGTPGAAGVPGLAGAAGVGGAAGAPGVAGVAGAPGLAGPAGAAGAAGVAGAPGAPGTAGAGAIAAMAAITAIAGVPGTAGNAGAAGLAGAAGAGGLAGAAGRAVAAAGGPGGVGGAGGRAIEANILNTFHARIEADAPNVPSVPLGGGLHSQAVERGLGQVAQPLGAPALQVIQGGGGGAGRPTTGADPLLVELLQQMVQLTALIAKNSDPARTQELLRRQSALLEQLASGGSSSRPGEKSRLYNTYDEAKRWAAAGVTGFGS